MSAMSGHVAGAGWIEEPLASWIVSLGLFSACFPGCSVGVTTEDGEPAAKTWRFVTSSQRLAYSLGTLKCSHSKHGKLQGKFTRLPAFYPRPLCVIMLQSLFPHVINKHVASLPDIPAMPCQHRRKLVPGLPSVPIDVVMFGTGMNKIVTPAYVHKLLDRSEWRGRPEVLARKKGC